MQQRGTSKIEGIAKIETALRRIHNGLAMIDEARHEMVEGGQDSREVDAYITAAKQAVIDHIAGVTPLH